MSLKLTKYNLSLIEKTGKLVHKNIFKIFIHKWTFSTEPQQNQKP